MLSMASTIGLMKLVTSATSVLLISQGVRGTVG
jgi:hypothetical protein